MINSIKNNKLDNSEKFKSDISMRFIKPKKEVKHNPNKKSFDKKTIKNNRKKNLRKACKKNTSSRAKK